MQTKLHIKLTSFLLVLTMLFSLVACNFDPDDLPSEPPDWTNPTISDPNGGILGDDILTEETINEIIIKETYLQELVLVEEKIGELLDSEEMINEVILCKTIYVPEEHIEEFADNSGTKELFGDGVDFKAMAKKIAIGVGVIVSIVVLTKVGIPEPIVTTIIKPAMNEAIKGAVIGAGIGSLAGGFTGAANEIDETQRTSAIASVAAATVGLILSIVSLVAAIPSGGASSIGVAAGIKIAVAAVFALAATAGTVTAGVNAVKTFQATSAIDIDWNNIDWSKVGVSAAQEAINTSADGFMWGAIAGAVQGGAKGYENYEKYNAPYSKYIADIDGVDPRNTRMGHVPAADSKVGKWTGKRGESDFVLNEPLSLPDGTKVTKVTYKNGIPDFSPYQIAKVKIPKMTNDRDSNFTQADDALAKIWTKNNYQGKKWTGSDVEKYRKSNHLTWHEMNNMEYMQLVPTDVNATFGHLGGVGEYNAMIGKNVGVNYD